MTRTQIKVKNWWIFSVLYNICIGLKNPARFWGYSSDWVLGFVILTFREPVIMDVIPPCGCVFRPTDSLCMLPGHGTRVDPGATLSGVHWSPPGGLQPLWCSWIAVVLVEGLGLGTKQAFWRLYLELQCHAARFKPHDCELCWNVFEQ